jgi:D-alanyl-D-alanine dipeptidase
MVRFILFCGLILIVGCIENQTKTHTESSTSVKTVDTVKIKKVIKKKFRTLEGLADTTFVRLADFSDGLYDCAECYMRVKTAKALIKANRDFWEKGVKIKFFDCYRPNSVQYKMWEIVPNPQYVANPVKGSIHNKGGAVDITLVTLEDEELDMGTDFDYFGKSAYHDNLDLPQEVLDNRKLLKETMENHGFWSIRTEWWHYNLSAGTNDKVADFKWDCE